jgi:fluoride exporter
MTVLLVALGAAVGAPLRYLVDRAVQRRHDSVFPWGTFAVNVAGSFLLGLLVAGATAHGVPGSLVALLGTGLCGALTTYSTFGYETIRLLEQRSRQYAVLNAAASVVGGLGAAFCGFATAQAIWH